VWRWNRAHLFDSMRVILPRFLRKFPQRQEANKKQGKTSQKNIFFKTPKLCLNAWIVRKEAVDAEKKRGGNIATAMKVTTKE